VATPQWRRCPVQCSGGPGSKSQAKWPQENLASKQEVIDGVMVSDLDVRKDCQSEMAAHGVEVLQLLPASKIHARTKVEKPQHGSPDE